MIDWSRIAELKRDFGEDDFAEVLDLFVEETDAVISRIADGQSADLARDLHFVKGSAENMGMAELAVLCRSGEASISADQDPTISNIRQIYAESCAKIRSRESA